MRWLTALLSLFPAFSACSGGGGGGPVAPVGSPPAPTALELTRDYLTVTLTWSDNSLDEDRFEVKQKVGGDDWQVAAVLAPDTTTWSTSIYHNTRYEFAVTAANANGESLFSNSVSVYVEYTPPPPSGCTLVLDPDGAADDLHLVLAEPAAPSCLSYPMLERRPLWMGGPDIGAVVVTLLDREERGGTQRLRFSLTLEDHAALPPVVPLALAFDVGDDDDLPARIARTGLSSWIVREPLWSPAAGVPITAGRDYLLEVERDGANGRWSAWLDGLPVARDFAAHELLAVRAAPRRP